MVVGGVTGADPNMLNALGATPAHLATAQSHIETTSRLLTSETIPVDVEIPNKVLSSANPTLPRFCSNPKPCIPKVLLKP